MGVGGCEVGGGGGGAFQRSEDVAGGQWGRDAAADAAGAGVLPAGRPALECCLRGGRRPEQGRRLGWAGFTLMGGRCEGTMDSTYDFSYTGCISM